MKKILNRYKIHLVIGLFFFPFLLISAMTGFFRANHKWFWKEDYKKIKSTAYTYNVGTPAIPIDSVIGLVSTTENFRGISEIRLRREIGRLFYEVRLTGAKPVLVDANNGSVLSPISRELAASFASQYLKEDAAVKSVYLDEAYTTRKDHKPRPVYVVEFADALNTKILLDRNNGEIEEEIDDNLKFGFWMVKLHDYDFLNSKRIILSIVGLGLTAVGLSGFYLWLRKKERKKKEKKKKTRDFSRSKTEVSP